MQYAKSNKIGNKYVLANLSKLVANFINFMASDGHLMERTFID